MEVVMIPLPSDLEELCPSSPLLAADVFLLCFSIADHASLYTALDHWLPLLKVVLKTVVVIRMEIESIRSRICSMGFGLNQILGADVEIMLTKTS